MDPRTNSIPTKILIPVLGVLFSIILFTAIYNLQAQTPKQENYRVVTYVPSPGKTCYILFATIYPNVATGISCLRDER